MVPRRADCLAAIRAALEARADVNARRNDSRYGGWTPLHNAACLNTNAAAVAAAVEVLVAAGADVRARTVNGFGPLHRAAWNTNAEAAVAAVQALLPARADPLAKDGHGHTPLFWAFFFNKSQVAEALLAAMPTDAALKDLCNTTEPWACQLLPAFIANRLPLTDAQWALIPVAPRPGLCRILPAALACSGDQARQLVWRLPRPDAERLRTAVLCLVRVQRRMVLSRQEREQPLPQHLPTAIVERILCSALDGSC